MFNQNNELIIFLKFKVKKIMTEVRYAYRFTYQRVSDKSNQLYVEGHNWLDPKPDECSFDFSRYHKIDGMTVIVHHTPYKTSERLVTYLGSFNK